MKKLVWLTMLVPTLCFANESPLEEYFDVGSLTTQPQSHLGKSVASIDSSILEEYKPLSLTDSLHNVPGVYVKRVNGLSGLTSIRLRGARSIDTKLLYNGVPLQDPSDPQGSANPFLGDLLTNGIESIEILKGASSSTWGSEAIGGVVNIKPKKGVKNGLRTFLEYGTFRIIREWIEATAPGLFVQASRLDTEGFDAHDEYGQTNLNGSFNRDISEVFLIRGAWLFQDTRAMLNEGPIITEGKLQDDRDDDNDRREYRVLGGNVIAELDISDSLELQSKVGITESDRRFIFLPDSEFDFYSDGIFRGNDFIFQNQLTYKHSDYLATTIGHLYERQWYELDQKDLRESDQADTYSNDFFIEESIDYKNLHLIIAGRENTHERAKSRATFDISGLVDIPKLGTRLYSHFGTGYRYPSLYELYGAFLTSFGRFEVGNPRLSPERAKSFDVGIESRITPYTDVGVTFFWRDIRNRIEFAGFSYANTEGVDRSKGVEAFLETYLMDGLSARTSYTLTEGARLVDVPEHVWDASLRYAKDKWVANVRTRFAGRRDILVFNLDDFTVGRLKEDGHFTVDATIAYQIKPDVEVYLRAENLLSEDYHESGYRTPGARVYGGITWTI